MSIKRAVHIEFNMINFNEYLEFIKENSKQGQKQLDQLTKEYADKYKTTPKEIQESDVLDTIKHQLDEVFPTILLSGYLVSLYGFFEKELVILHDDLITSGQATKSYKSYKTEKGTINQMYVSLNDDVNIPIRTSDKVELDYVRLIRNAITHNQGIMGTNYLTDVHGLQNYLQKHKIMNSNNEIQLTFIFCEYITNFTYGALEEIYKNFNVKIRGYIS
ncbi:hypothetical protein ABEP16_13180 [Priestia aryabhattai]|uniref:hypothetical protein n=1 Tax=Priestia aryabhattai TaxID=412384 RepID=UPI003D2A19B9